MSKGAVRVCKTAGSIKVAGSEGLKAYDVQDDTSNF